jgi:hypothetical protein
MEFGISVQLTGWRESHKDIGPRIGKLRAAFRKAFPRSKLDGFNSLQLRTPNEALVDEIMGWMDANINRWMNREGERYRIVLLDMWTIDEIVRARWVEIHAKKGPANADMDWEPLNEYPRVLCEGCGNIDDSVLPRQIKISDLVIRSTDEIFYALNGLTVVNERVKDLFLQSVGDQLQWGQCQVISSSGKPKELHKPKTKFFWIRPKYLVGGYVNNQPIEGYCPKCGEAQYSPNVVDAKLIRNNRTTIEYFGSPDWNIAACGTSGHYRRRTGAALQQRDTFVSGGLWAYIIDLWASVNTMSLREAAIDLVRTFALEPTPRSGTEKRNG